MLAGLLYIAVVIASFIGFGSIGAGVGQRLEKSGAGTGFEVPGMVFFGVGGTALVLWILNLIFVGP